MQADEELLFTFFNEINIIAQLSANEFERALPDGLTLSQFSVLNWFVRVDSSASPGRLATAFMVTRGAMTNTLKKLESKGLVRIEPDETSGRSKKITLTQEGRRSRKRAIASCHPVLAEVAREFPPTMLKRHLPLLQNMRKYLDESRYEQ